jgi:hypothetical protein
MFARSVSLFVLLLCLPLAACEDVTSAPDAGTLTLMLMGEPDVVTSFASVETPPTISHALVAVTRIELVGEGPPLEVFGEGQGDGVPFLWDLTAQNFSVPIAEEVTIPGGIYTQLRLVIPWACIHVAASGEVPEELTYASSIFPFDEPADLEGVDLCADAYGGLQLPSLAETGIKVDISLDVDGDSHLLGLSFPAEESFVEGAGHPAGQSDMWVMSPVLHVEVLPEMEPIVP